MGRNFVDTVNEEPGHAQKSIKLDPAMYITQTNKGLMTSFFT